MIVGGRYTLWATLPIAWDAAFWLGLLILACWPVGRYDTAALSAIVSTFLLLSFLVQRMSRYCEAGHEGEGSFRVPISALWTVVVASVACAPIAFALAVDAMDYAGGVSYADASFPQNR